MVNKYEKIATNELEEKIIHYKELISKHEEKIKKYNLEINVINSIIEKREKGEKLTSEIDKLAIKFEINEIEDILNEKTSKLKIIFDKKEKLNLLIKKYPKTRSIEEMRRQIELEYTKNKNEIIHIMNENIKKHGTEYGRKLNEKLNEKKKNIRSNYKKSIEEIDYVLQGNVEENVAFSYLIKYMNRLEESTKNEIEKYKKVISRQKEIGKVKKTK